MQASSSYFHSRYVARGSRSRLRREKGRWDKSSALCKMLTGLALYSLCLCNANGTSTSEHCFVVSRAAQRTHRECRKAERHVGRFMAQTVRMVVSPHRLPRKWWLQAWVLRCDLDHHHHHHPELALPVHYYLHTPFPFPLSSPPPLRHPGSVASPPLPIPLRPRPPLRQRLRHRASLPTRASRQRQETLPPFIPYRQQPPLPRSPRLLPPRHPAPPPILLANPRSAAPAAPTLVSNSDLQPLRPRPLLPRAFVKLRLSILPLPAQHGSRRGRRARRRRV